MKEIKYTNKEGSWYHKAYSETLVDLEFKSVKELREFVNSRICLFTYEGNKYKIIRLKKIKQTKIEATIEMINLREYNLEILGI
jgi:hypothetical protein